jgi:hypothetical protein
MAFRRALGVALLLVTFGCQKIGIAKQYEYDERIDLSLDGSAIVDVNASIAALVALRGASLDVDPEARFDREAVRRMYEGPGAAVRELSAFRRHGRRFVRVRVQVNDLRQLSKIAPLSWSRYELEPVPPSDVQEFRFVQEVREPTRGAVGDIGWTGEELVAFRVHLPSRINFHNSSDNIERGNILVWEQPLRERLSGMPLRMEARMDGRTILYRTLWLFGGSFAAAMALLATIVWWVARKGRSVVPA